MRIGTKALNAEISELVKTKLKDIKTENIIKELDELATKATKEADQIDYANVVQAAQGLLVTYNVYKNVKKITVLEKMRSVLPGQSENGLKDLTDRKMTQNNLKLMKIRSIYSSAIQFDIVLNAFLGGLQKKIAYVDVTSGNRIVGEIDYRNLPKYITKQGKIVSSLANEMNEIETISNKNMSMLNKMLQTFEEMFQQQKIDITKRRDEKQRSQTKQAQIVYFANKDKYFQILNIGDLNEAYVNLALSKDDSNIDLYTFFTNYLSQIDTTPSILEEDVQSEAFQYGVKSKGASAPALNQFLRTAKLIVSTPSDTIYSREALKTEIVNQFKSPSTRNKFITDSAEKCIADIVWIEG